MIRILRPYRHISNGFNSRIRPWTFADAAEVVKERGRGFATGEAVQPPLLLRPILPNRDHRSGSACQAVLTQKACDERIVALGADVVGQGYLMRHLTVDDRRRRNAAASFDHHQWRCCRSLCSQASFRIMSVWSRIADRAHLLRPLPHHAALQTDRTAGGDWQCHNRRGAREGAVPGLREKRVDVGGAIPCLRAGVGQDPLPAPEGDPMEAKGHLARRMTPRGRAYRRVDLSRRGTGETGQNITPRYAS